MVGNVGYSPKYHIANPNFAATPAPAQSQKDEQKPVHPLVQRPERGFWDRNLSAIIGITSIALVGIALSGRSKASKQIEELGENVNKRLENLENRSGRGSFFTPRGGSYKSGSEADRAADSIGPRLSHQSVFENYTSDANVPTLEALPGMDEAKKRFQTDVLDVIKYEDIYKSADVGAVNGVILHGPPGTGKTNLLKVIAKELKAEVAKFAIAKDGSPFVNQAAINLKNRADFVKNAAIDNPEKQYIAFFDEIEGMLTEDRSGTNPSRQELVKTVLIILDEFKEVPNLRVMATTNETLNHSTGFFANMNEAAMDRFPTKVFIGNPDKASRSAAVKHHLRKVEGAKSLTANNAEINTISDELDGYSHRNIEQITQGAKRFFAQEQAALRAEGKPEDITLSRKHFTKAIEEFKASKDPAAKASAAQESNFQNPLEAMFGNMFSDDNLSKIEKSVEGLMDGVSETFGKLMNGVSPSGGLAAPEDEISKIVKISEENASRKEAANLKKEMDELYDLTAIPALKSIEDLNAFFKANPNLSQSQIDAALDIYRKNQAKPKV